MSRSAARCRAQRDADGLGWGVGWGRRDRWGYAVGMLAANIWHWWIGVIMAVAGGAAVLGLVAGYLKQVTAQRYPGGRRHREQEL